jgi:hypothetical protein
MFCQESVLDILIEQALELVFIPACIDFPPFDDKSGISSNPITQGFINSNKGLNIDELDEEAMFVKSR